jgi:hypothetical protein
VLACWLANLIVVLSEALKNDPDLQRKRRSNETRLDQLFAEPIVQQLMHRDRIDEATGSESDGGT